MLTESVNHIFEPNPLACGQAVLAMLCNLPVDFVIESIGTDREITLKQLKNFLKENEISFCEERKEAQTKGDLPQIAVLSLETPKCWHWSLYFNGVFYDPEYGVLSDFPLCKRKYYWKIG